MWGRESRGVGGLHQGQAEQVKSTEPHSMAALICMCSLIFQEMQRTRSTLDKAAMRNSRDYREQMSALASV